jgi:hypothetical protein
MRLCPVVPFGTGDWNRLHDPLMTLAGRLSLMTKLVSYEAIHLAMLLRLAFSTVALR